MVERAQVSFDVAAIRSRLQGKMGDAASAYPLCIERRLPHILVQLDKLWGTPGADTYLEQLMLDDREGRHGFPPDVAQELFVLIKVHAALGLQKSAGGAGWNELGESAR